MRLWKQLSEILRKPVPREEKVSSRDLLFKKFHSFQELLSQNNSILELMADMEEKLSGEFLLDRPYIDDSVMAIVEGVKKIVDKLNEISKEKHQSLYERFNKINSEIEEILTRGREIPISRYTIPFDEITGEMSNSLGNKNANLGEVRNRLRLPSPDGFAISAYAYKKFMEHNELIEKINKILSDLQVDNLDVLNKKSCEIQEWIVKGEIPEDIEREIMDAYSRLCDRYGKKVMVSVRSSALQEDGEFSFAGQYSTFLNVPSDLILQRYKEVIASLFSPRAIFYYKTKGLPEYEMVMSVGVLAMVDAKAGGVIYSRDPNNPTADTLIISVVRGLGKCLVEGAVTPETYILSRGNSPSPSFRKGGLGD